VNFLLDTNVISELRKGKRGDAALTRWARGVDLAACWVSAVVVLEVERGVRQLERRDSDAGLILRRWLAGEFTSRFQHRVLPVDAEVARMAASMQVPDPLPDADALIAATALVHGLTVVSRNVRDFQRTGVAFVDPFQT